MGRWRGESGSTKPRAFERPTAGPGRLQAVNSDYWIGRASSSSSEYWDERADLDDELAATLDPADATGRKNNLIHALHVCAIQRAGIDQSDRVLDFGCGTGRLMQTLSSSAASVSGVDISARMVERACEYGDARIYDGRRLPFHDGAFDVVVSAYVLAMYRDQPGPFKALVDEIVRVLIRGGRLVLVDRVEPGSPILGLDAWRRDLAAAGLGITLVEPVRAAASRGTVRSASRASPSCFRWSG